MRYPKRTQYKHCKKRYRITNWRDYDRSLCMRGDLTIWVSEAALEGWHSAPRGRPGGQQLYSRVAIETALTVRMVLHLPLRQTEGFLRSLARWLDLPITVPDHTTISRRAKRLGRLSIGAPSTKRPVNLVIDSTGLSVHAGARRKPPKRSAWRKLHVAVDRDTGAIEACEVTASRASDPSQVGRLLRGIGRPVGSATMDGAYESRATYTKLVAHGVRPDRVLVPPRRGAKLSRRQSQYDKIRNHRIRAIGRVGRMEWERASGYTKRSIVENVIGRYKSILGGRMRARSLAGQRAEGRIGCRILNTMSSLGMPQSELSA